MNMNYFSKCLIFSSLIVGASLFQSCKEDVDDSITPPEAIKPYKPDEASALSPLEQKEKMEAVAIGFMNQMPASDFKDIGDLAKYINNTYVDDYDWDNVDDWAEGCYDLALEALGTKTTEKESETRYGYYYEYNDIFTNYKSLLLASNFTGHFKARNGGWQYSKADDLQFIFDDQNGNECVLKLETSGQVKHVYIGKFDNYTGYDRTETYYSYIYKYYYDHVELTVGVPENITVSLTENGSSVVKTTVKIDLTKLDEDEFDLSSSNLSLSALTELNNGYSINVTQVAYTEVKPYMTLKMSKNGVDLLTFAASADLNDIPSCNLSAFTSYSFDIDDYNTDDTNAKNTFVKFDIMGKLQIQGVISDVSKYVNYLGKADKNESNESSFVSYINQANSLSDVNLFYDGSAAKQATVKFEPFIDGAWNGVTYWYAEPVMTFYDGSSYSSFGAFFNEDDFKRVVDAFRKLANRYAGLVDEEIDW